jgi:hypothetical protein
MSNSYSRIPAPKAPKKENSKSSTQPATKAEVELLRQKIVEKIDQNTDKAATILREWMKSGKK